MLLSTQNLPYLIGVLHTEICQVFQQGLEKGGFPLPTEMRSVGERSHFLTAVFLNSFIADVGNRIL